MKRRLAPWRVRIWQEPNGTWSADYRRRTFRSTEGWSVHDCGNRDQARRELAAFVHEDRAATGASR